MAGLQVIALSFAALAVVSGQGGVNCDECVNTYAKCSGKGIDDVIDCCKLEDECVRKNEFYSQCRPSSKPVPAGWNGDILTCGPMIHHPPPPPGEDSSPEERALPAAEPPSEEDPTVEVTAVAATTNTEEAEAAPATEPVEEPPTDGELATDAGPTVQVAAVAASGAGLFPDDDGSDPPDTPSTSALDDPVTTGTATATAEDTDDDAAPQVNQSSAKCIVISIGDSEVNSKNAIAEATADASAFICNGETNKTAESIATATASAFAVAVADASVECELVGDANVQVDATASAVAAGNVWVKAYADAFASAGDCEKCDAFALSFGYIEKQVFLKAVAEAEVKLAAYTEPGGPPLIVKVNDYKSEVQVAVARAFASALAGAADYKNTDGCLAWVNAGGCIWTPESEDPDSCFECEAVAVSAGAIQEIDALAEASALAVAWTCGDAVSIVELEVTAKALAEATAEAISVAYASCELDGGWACAVADTGITETAEAVARAYAELWAGAYVCQQEGTCVVEVEAIVEAVGSVLVQAATDAFAGLCVDGAGSWTVASLSAEIEKSSLCALAEAHVDAVAIAPNTCLVGGIVYAEASEATCSPP